MRPRAMTIRRVLAPRASANSEVAKRTPTPVPATAAMVEKMSDLAPMSMPRVGSSMSSMRGAVMSALAMTTFCWLPPDREVMPMEADSALTRTSSMPLEISASSCFRLTWKRWVSVLRAASDILRPTLMSWTRPSAWRSSGTRTMPSAMRSAMGARVTSLPSRRIWPAAGRWRPARVSSSSVRPAPMRP